MKNIIVLLALLLLIVVLIIIPILLFINTFHAPSWAVFMYIMLLIAMGAVTVKNG